MERVKRVLVLGEAKVGKTWLLAQLFKDISSTKRANEQLTSQLAAQTDAQTAIREGPEPVYGSLIEGEKALKSQQGCQVHVHLLNEHYPMERDSNTFFFVEFHELSGSICLNKTMMQVYAYQKNFDGLMVCFDMGNLTSL